TKVLVHAAADDGTVTLSVSNRGKEIAPEHLEHIFDRFYRGDAARGQGTGGAGLGLAIAKEIVVAHGGSIEATSEDGLTTFTIRVPR
ncbi:MAG: ATP-binding protein, partial [Bacteroidales bacterium]